jgi:hypothetical protein
MDTEPKRAFSFSWLIEPCDAVEFISKYWEQKPVYLSRQPQHYQELPSISDVDRILTQGSLSYPDVQLTRDGMAPKTEEFTFPDGRIDPDAVCELLSWGATAIFNKMQLRLPSLGALCKRLNDDLAIRFQTNLYLSPPHRGGFDIHYDTHDVFVL